VVWRVVARVPAPMGNRIADQVTSARTRGILTAAAAAMALVALPACEAPPRSGSNQPGVVKPSAVGVPGAPETRQSVRDASEQDLAAALAAKGVPDAAQWAEYIVAGQPYTDDAAGQEKLRQTLLRYDPSPEELEKIMSTVRP
jgi:hypothetical protein